VVADDKENREREGDFFVKISGFTWGGVALYR